MIYIKGKVGDIELIQPNKEFLNLVHEVLNQNKEILEMNKELLKNLTTPFFYVPKEEE